MSFWLEPEPSAGELFWLEPEPSAGELFWLEPEPEPKLLNSSNNHIDINKNPLILSFGLTCFLNAT